MYGNGEMNINTPGNQHTLKLTINDVKEEMDYWESTVICRTLGINPLLHVMEGYFRRIWGRMGIDKIIFAKKNTFLIRFLDMGGRDKALKNIFIMFDKKPIVVNPWTCDMTLDHEQILKVPTWVQLPSLPLKYWGKDYLMKIASLIGDPVQIDRAISKKEKVHFARILVEVPLHTPVKEIISFENELGVIIQQKVDYEWKPCTCEKCGLLGHYGENCRKSVKRVWRIKSQPQHSTTIIQQPEPTTSPKQVVHDPAASPKQVVPDTTDLIMDADGFQRTTNPIKRRATAKLKKLKSLLKTLNNLQFNDIEARVTNAKAVLKECQNKLHDDLVNATLANKEKLASEAYKVLVKAHNSFLAKNVKLNG